MKTRTIICGVLLGVVLAGCSKSAMMDNAAYNPGEDIFGRETDAIVTVKKSPTDTVFFQLDDETRLFPLGTVEYSGMYRAMCHLYICKDVQPGYGYVTDVRWIEPLEQGPVVSSATGPDGLDIEDDWMTCVEDGWLTLHYSSWWGSNAVRHTVSLVTGTDASDPYLLELRHDAGGDRQEKYADALIAFDINSLPDTGDEYKTLTLKWKDTEGASKTRQFEFRSRK